MSQNTRPETTSAVLEYGGLECAGDVLREQDSDPSAMRIKRDEARAVSWRYGLRTPSPVLQVLFGGALAAIGYWPLGFFIKWVNEGGSFPMPVAFLVPIPAIGVWLVLSVLRRAYFVEVDTANGKKRLFFRGHVQAKEIDAFVDAVVERWNLVRNK